MKIGAEPAVRLRASRSNPPDWPSTWIARRSGSLRPMTIAEPRDLETLQLLVGNVRHIDVENGVARQGIAALVAASLVPEDRRTAAVGRVMLGLTVATIVGVPLANVLGQVLSWRWAFWINVPVAVVVLIVAIVAINVFEFGRAD